jgi:hypothetical protein
MFGWQRQAVETAAKDNPVTIFITIITAVWALTAICALTIKDK